MAKVAIIMGSKSDLEIMKKAADIFDEFDVEHEMHIMSAHRTPDDVAKFTREAKSNGIAVIIAGAGAAAHLAGVVAAHTILPVIGVPLSGGPLGGVEALYSTVMMPQGIPVATVAVNGSANAALLAIQMMALSDEGLTKKLEDHRAKMRNTVIAANEGLN